MKKLILLLFSGFLMLTMQNVIAQPKKVAKHAKQPDYFYLKCFKPIDLKVDVNHNVFVFFQNQSKDKSCRDLRKLPYHYISVEVYSLDTKLADEIHAHFARAKHLRSLLQILEFLRLNKISCHRVAVNYYWPYSVYYGCVHTKAIASS
jgi:hypothetical protein